MELKIPDLLEKQRVDVFLTKHFTGLSRKFFKEQCHAGLVEINGKAVSSNFILAGGENLKLNFELKTAEALAAAAASCGGGRNLVKVIYEDDEILVIDKPREMPCVRLSPTDEITVADCLVDIEARCFSASPDKREGGLIHRLDNFSSGLLIAAKTRANWEKLSGDLKQGKIDKDYVVLTEGIFPHVEIQLELNLVLNKTKVKISPEEKPEAVKTSAKLVLINSGQKNTEQFGSVNYSIVKVSAKFAKRHQVRAYLSHLSSPLVGDDLYGAKTKLNTIFEKDLSGFILHASRIKFRHPGSEKELTLMSSNELLNLL